MQHGAVQCGFCTPGMILKSYSLLQKNANPGREDIIRALDQNLCRCSSYSRVVEAVQAAGAEMRGGRAS